MADDLILRNQLFGGRGTPKLGFPLYGLSPVVIITPGCRTRSIDAENRISGISAEPRELTIAAENRTYRIGC